MNSPSSAAIASGFSGHLPGMLPTEHAAVRMRERGIDRGVLD